MADYFNHIIKTLNIDDLNKFPVDLSDSTAKFAMKEFRSADVIRKPVIMQKPVSQEPQKEQISRGTVPNINKKPVGGRRVINSYDPANFGKFDFDSLGVNHG